MGAWGFGSFENDTALDWIGDFADEPSLKSLSASLEPLADDADDIPPDEVWDEETCPTVVAAAEVVAAMRGHAHPDIAEELEEWIEENRAAADTKLVKKAIDAVTMVRKSELYRSCFFDDDGVRQWEAEIDGLLHRLKA